MKTTQELENRVKELGRLRTQYSRQGVELIKQGDRKAGHQMMKLMKPASGAEFCLTS